MALNMSKRDIEMLQTLLGLTVRKYICQIPNGMKTL